MLAIHVILSVRSSLTREALRQELQQHADIRVVDEVSSPGELLFSTAVKQADVVVLESEERSHMPAVLSHLFAEFPQILAIVVSDRGKRAMVYRQTLCQRAYVGESLADILTELRTATPEYWARTESDEIRGGLR